MNMRSSFEGTKAPVYLCSSPNPHIALHKNMASKNHPGFAAVQKKIAAKEGVSLARAGAILANSSRHASAAAKAKNPNLRKVKGGY